MISTLKPRVAIYGIGQYGKKIARLALQKGLTIVAAYNRAGNKIGQDIGRLAGLERDVGVIVQDCNTANFEHLEADIGIVTMTNYLSQNLAAYKRFLNAGLNVLCHGTESYYPYGCNPDIAAEIDALAKNNNVTFTGSGIWDMSRVWAGIFLAGPCTEIKSLYHSSITDLTGQAGTRQACEGFGAGITVAQFYGMGLDTSLVAISYKTIPEHVLFALGYTITNTRVFVEPVVTDVPLDSAYMGRVIPAGACIGTRIVGEINTAQGVTARAEIELRLFKEGEVEHMFWSVDGMPRTRVRVERSDSADATAGCLFNRIPDVIAARPGIVLLSQLGPLKHTAMQ